MCAREVLPAKEVREGAKDVLPQEAREVLPPSPGRRIPKEYADEGFVANKDTTTTDTPLKNFFKTLLFTTNLHFQKR